MKRLIALFVILSLLILTLTACSRGGADPFGNNSSVGGDDESFGDALDVYDGIFEGEKNTLTVTCISGTDGAYTLENNVLAFTALFADSVYSVSGELSGYITVDIGDDYKLDIELTGTTIVSTSAPVVTVNSGDEVSITAKKDTVNYLYDLRPEISAEDTESKSGAIHSEVDLKICGKGTLTVVSKENNGIHSKKDLQIKNLTLEVVCRDNALKGNDSVTLESGTTTLIATVGDGIKTADTDISEKGNQRGNVTVNGGTHTVYAACDGVDAAHDIIIEGEGTALTVYTDKYSNYSEEVTAVDGEAYYFRFTSDLYKYSVKYYNSDTDYRWVDATYHSTVSGGRTSYYYYSFPRDPAYSQMQFFIYTSDMPSSQESEYAATSDLLAPSDAYDTIAISNYGYSWTNYTTTVQMGPGGMGGPGGMNDGNTEKSDHSTKGLKAGNGITVGAGTVTVKAYDDALHANADATLENGLSPTGNITISGGEVTVYSNDDGIHSDGRLEITGGTVAVTYSYEGLEGVSVCISGGSVSITSRDDGVNSTATSGTGVEIEGGEVYIHAGGDGIDSNSRTSYSGILFSGGTTVVISTSGGNSAIDTEAGYAYTGGYVLAIMPQGAMTSEATHCASFSSIATKRSVSLTSGKTVEVSVDGDTVISFVMPASLSGTAIFLGSTSADVS